MHAGRNERVTAYRADGSHHDGLQIAAQPLRPTPLFGYGEQIAHLRRAGKYRCVELLAIERIEFP